MLRPKSARPRISRASPRRSTARSSAQKPRDTRPALKLAQRVLADSTLQTREVVMISDFQRSGWVRDENLRLPEGTMFKPMPITDAQPANLTVSNVLPQRSMFSGQERVSVTANVINRGPAAVNNVQVRLELDGRSVETQTVTVQPGAPASVTFQPFTLARAFTRGTVRIGDDALKQDNVFHFVASPAQRLPVLLVEPSRAPREASFFLLKALALGTEPAFQVDVRQGESVATTDLDRHRVVILNDVAALSSGRGAEGVRVERRRPSGRARRAGQLGNRFQRPSSGRPRQRRRSGRPWRRAGRARLQPSRARALQGTAKRQPDDRALFPLSRNHDEARAGRRQGGRAGTEPPRRRTIR